MKEDNVHDARERYEKMLAEGCRGYFDSVEIEAIADQYLEEMEYEKALDATMFGLELYPTNDIMKLQQSHALLALNRVKECEAVLNAVSEVGIEYFLLKGEVETIHNNDKVAIQHFSNAIKCEDSTLEDCMEILDILFENSKVELIIELIPTIEQTFNDVLPLYREIALAFFTFGNSEEAIKWYNKILDIEPYSAEDWIALAKTHFASEEYEKAIEACNFALAIEEKNESAIILKGYCLYYNKQYKEAIEQFEELLLVTEQKDLAYRLLSEVCVNLEEYRMAIEFLKMAININNSDSEYYYLLALNYMHIDDYPQAIETLRHALTIDVDNYRAHSLLGDLLFQNGEYKEAYINYREVTLEQLCEMGSAMNMIMVCQLLHYDDEAIESLIQFIDIQPGNPRYILTLISILFKNDCKEEALQWIEYAKQKAQCKEELKQFCDEEEFKIWESIEEQLTFIQDMGVKYGKNQSEDINSSNHN